MTRPTRSRHTPPVRSRALILRELRLREALCDPNDQASIRRGWVEALSWVLGKRRYP